MDPSRLSNLHPGSCLRAIRPSRALSAWSPSRDPFLLVGLLDGGLPAFPGLTLRHSSLRDHEGVRPSTRRQAQDLGPAGKAADATVGL